MMGKYYNYFILLVRHLYFTEGHLKIAYLIYLLILFYNINLAFGGCSSLIISY